MNRNLRRDFLEQRRVGADRRWIARSKHVKLDPFRRQIASQACGAQSAYASDGWKCINDQQNSQGIHCAVSWRMLGHCERYSATLGPILPLKSARQWV